MLKFDLTSSDPHSQARAGKLTTDHGSIETPIFMPVGTIGTVKGVHQHELVNDIKAQIILGNTYHLFLRPGIEILEKAGGLHKFMNWDGPILTDSGGYQVYSLGEIRKIKPEGVTFRSHIDGRKLFFSPEIAIDIQRSIGGDIIMAFDECTPYPCDYNYAKKSLKLTHKWLQRCCDHFDNTQPKYDYSQTMIPIVQGSTYTDLRKESAKVVADFDRPANAIGGLSVGEPAPEMYAMTDIVCNELPWEKPRYLMGVGTPMNILECIALGIDMFDCVLPSRNARHGLLYTAEGMINIKNAKWKDCFDPIDPNATTEVSRVHTKAYLRHLFQCKELLAGQIATIHNLGFYLWLVTTAREKIVEGTFAAWKTTMVQNMSRRL
jgi:queuine tRNA-ribosyltransferase